MGLVCILFLAGLVLGDAEGGRSGNGFVEVHLNGGDDVAYIGQWNIIEIWIENDAVLDGASMGFEISIGRDYYLDSTYGAFGYINPENDALGAFNLAHQENAMIDNISPDSIAVGGASIPPYGLPANYSRICYTMRFYIEPRQGELAGGVSIDNIFMPPALTWTFHDVASYPPLYQGNENTSETVPDAPPVDFDIVYPDLGGFQLSQIDWYNGDGTLVLDNSTWGLFTFDYIVDTVDIYYVNLSLAQLGNPLQWVVRNLPLFPALHAGPRSDGAHINLEEIGISTGDSAGLFEMSASFSASPLADMPTEPILTGLFLQSRRQALDQPEDMGDFADPGAVAPLRIPDDAVQHGTTRDMDPLTDSSYRVQEQPSHCMAGACARSIDWLNRVHQLGMEESAQEIYDSLAARHVSDPNQGGPFSRDEWTIYKNDYARTRTGNKIVTKVWDAGNNMPPLDSLYGIEESNENFIDWLKREIKTEDVEIAIEYDGGGAHIVTAVDVFEDSDGNIYIKYRDDNDQGNDVVGDQSISTTRLVVRDDGKYGLDSRDNQIYFALSESVESVTRDSTQEANMTVRNVFEIHQDAYHNPQVANDVHFRVHTDTEIRGWKIKIPAFGNATAERAGSDSLHVSANAGAVPYCTRLPIEVNLYLNSWNSVHIDQIEWTRDTGDKSGRGSDTTKAAPGFGWMVEPPVQTGPGVYEHAVHICNYDTDEWFTVAGIGLLPSNEYYDDIKDLTPSDFPVQVLDMDLLPGDCLNYTLVEEDGLSDHIYGYFRIIDQTVDTAVVDWFDHPTRPVVHAVCGDANGDSTVNVGDAVYIISYVFKGGPAPEPICAGNANGDGDVNVGDAVWLISYVFKGGLPPVEGCCE